MGALRQSTEGQRSVVDEVLRAQARNRRLRRAGAVAVMLALALLVGLWLIPPSRPPLTTSPVVVALPWVAQTGTVTGYIEPCVGAALPMGTSDGAPLFSAAATVEALSGQERMEPTGHGVYQLVLPTVIAARERVSQNQKFRLDHLAPGRYVILAQYAGGNATTFLDVTVAPAQLANILLPGTCK